MRRLGVFICALVALSLAWTMNSWQLPVALAISTGALWAYFLYARSRRAWNEHATLAHCAGLYSLQCAGSVDKAVRIEQVWRSPWFMTLRLLGDQASTGPCTVTLWRGAQTKQAWWALCLCVNRLSHQVRAQNKDS
ncbi:hypothetical protein [Alcaligenes parafaecalis]|uniref:Toxin CptA n=1 Tax=Alcaligenes parafaecalis TaxID=171260 RepID=A0ABT3VK60_9BURK|nr:hypothetical protein [Alcaligenes parafaecalis]MCX5463897.1 hypothetical protein [Alcaligenes parafaecalis]